MMKEGHPREEPDTAAQDQANRGLDRVRKHKIRKVDCVANLGEDEIGKG